jgi:Zn-dependent protease
MYVHEMGHVAALRRFGIAATAPMFVPGLGAFVRLRQYPAGPYEEARVGLAGPVWGAAACAAASFAGWMLHRSALLAIGAVGAWINLFNLLPVWSLDGARGTKALSRPQRVVVALTCALGFAIRHDVLLLGLALAMAFRCFEKEQPARGDTPITAGFVGLVLVLAILADKR